MTTADARRVAEEQAREVAQRIDDNTQALCTSWMFDGAVEVIATALLAAEHRGMERAAGMCKAKADEERKLARTTYANDEASATACMEAAVTAMDLGIAIRAAAEGRG